MKPRLEFILCSVLVAALLQATAFVSLATLWWGMDRGGGVARVLMWLPAAMLAAGLAAWFITGLHARTHALGKSWSAFGLAWRTVMLAMIFYPACVAGWHLLTALADQLLAAQPATMAQTMEILPTLVLYSAIFAVALGTLPALAITTLASKRYLRRIAVDSKGAT
jgi:RecA/RadA recombinase